MPRTRSNKDLEIEELKKELYLFKNKEQLARNYRIVNEENKKLKEENEYLKSQIPPAALADKKGKKLSQNDKAILQSILDDMSALADLDAVLFSLPEQRAAQFNLLKILMK